MRMTPCMTPRNAVIKRDAGWRFSSCRWFFQRTKQPFLPVFPAINIHFFQASVFFVYFPASHAWREGRMPIPENIPMVMQVPKPRAKVSKMNGQKIAENRMYRYQNRMLSYIYKHIYIYPISSMYDIYANIKGVFWWDPWHTIYSSTMDPSWVYIP